jgi:hypothetical protein
MKIVISNLRTALQISSLVPIFSAAAFGIFTPMPAQAQCINIFGNEVCINNKTVEPPVVTGVEPTVVIPTSDNSQVANASDRLRPDLNGLQIRNPGNGMIFWVDEGRIRHILNPSVYANIFVPKALNAIDTVSITAGPPVTSSNRLVRCGERNHPLENRIYFLDGGQKRHILSPAVMTNNNFDWNKVRTIDCPVLEGVPDGATIQ